MFKMPRQHTLRQRVTILLILLLAVLQVACEADPPAPPPTDGEMTVLYLDIGQGDATLIQSPNGKIMLIDGGNSYADADDVIIPALNDLGASQIDIMVVTHPDQDHIGGLPRIIERIPVEQIYLTGQLHPTQTYERLLTAIRDHDLNAVQTRIGTPLNFDTALDTRIYSPTDNQVDSTDTNNASIVIRMSYGEIDFLFLGDAEMEAAGVMLNNGYNLEAEILKVAHHGSHNGTSQRLLDAVDAEAGIISAGLDNRYDHPHTETLDLLQRNRVSVFRTDFQGSVRVTSDGRTYSVFTNR